MLTNRECQRINGTDQDLHGLNDINNPRTQEQPPRVNPATQFLDLQQREFDRATNEHGQFASLHEAFCVLMEEVHEFWDHVRKKRQDRKKEEMLTELIQIAAMAQKTAVSFKLLP